MTTVRFVRAASPYAAAMVTAVLAAMVVTTLSICRFDRDATMFLCGILAMGIFALVSRSANLRWVIARRTAQLSAARQKLAAELRLRAHAEASLERQTSNVRFLDEAMPSMIAYVDAQGIVRYHNRAYARWVRRPESSIDGQHVKDVMGAAAYAGLQSPLEEAMRGGEVRYERTQTMPDGEVFRLFVQYVPHFGDKGEVAGVFAILTDITIARDLEPAANDAPALAPSAGARLVAALEHDEFCLYTQPIVSLVPGSATPAFHEVLLRLREEEENHLPAGMFLPAAEENGLMPQIDRWVVRKVLSMASDAAMVHFVNLSMQSIAQAGFADFVDAELAAHDRNGGVLCFEIAESDLIANVRACRAFIEALAPRGCRFAVSGFSCNPQALQLLTQLKVSFVKLDGCIVLGLARNAADLARIKAINESAHAAGIRTIAACVEDEPTRAALERVATDLAQGFGIGEPQLMPCPPAPVAFTPLERQAA